MGQYRNVPRPRALDLPIDAALTWGGRQSNYGDHYVVDVGQGRPNLGDEGTYFTAITPTPGTGIVDGAVATFVETTPSLLIYNGPSNNRLFLDFIRYTTTVVSTASEQVQFTNTIDSGNRWTSGGTTLTVNGVNMDGGLDACGIAIRKGIITAKGASASRRVHSHTIYRWATLEVVGDVYEMNFGEPATQSRTNVATVSTFSRGEAPLVIGPDQSFVQVGWGTNMSTGPTHQIELGFWLR